LASLERGRVPSPRPIATKETQLIDRVEEMKLLKEAVYRAVHGEGGLVFLRGEAGIGKTRLTRELGAYARLHGVQVLYGRCPALFRMDGVPPYILWKEIVKDYLETCTPEQLYRVIGDQPVEVSKLVPEIKKVLRTIPESFELSPEHSRDRLFEAISQFITNISRETPLLVILDDLQWTDESSLLLMHYLARGVYKESLILLGAYRDTDVDERHPLSAVLAELNRERLLQSVQLKRMSFDDVSELIKQILEQDDVSTEFCELVYEKTRGNPFFAEEVIKSLKEEEIIYREDNRWKIKEVAKIEFPETVKSVIKKRISRLDDECQNVLTMASFIGNDFAFEALCGVTGIEAKKLLEIVEKMLRTGLIKETVIRGEDVFSFADVMVRDVVHEEVSRLRHKSLHATVGCALEKVYSKKVDEHLGELAYHFLEATDKERALDYFLKAGEKATKIYANNEAASYFQSALRLLEEKDGEPREKARIHETLGDIKRLVGEHDLCMKHWSEALLLWKQLNEKMNVSRLHCKMANALWEEIGDTKKAGEHHDEALKILEAEPESVELARVYEDMAHMYYRMEDAAKALSWAEKALESAEKLNNSEVIASSYASLGTISNFTGDMKKAVECLEKALKIALDNNYMETALRAYNNLATSLPAEENEKSLEYLEKGFELAKKVGEVSYRSWTGLVLAWVHIGMGDMNKALMLAEEAVAVDKKTGNMTHLSTSLDGLGLVYQIMGEWNKSERYHDEASNVLASSKLKDFQAVSANYWMRGWLHYEKGEFANARELFEKTCEVDEKAGARSHRMGDSVMLIRTYIEIGEIDKANELLDSLHKFALETGDKQLTADEDALRAILLRAQKKYEESIELFEKGLQEYEALNARRWRVYWLAKFVLSEYAQAYLERNREGDREKAENLLSQALEIFQKMGAKKDIEKTESKMIHLERHQIAPQSKPIGHVATGYEDLDRLLNGGIPLNYAVVLTSPPCDERDILVKSFLETGAKKGEIVFYVTADPGGVRPLAEEFQSSFYLFVCNPQADAIVAEASNVFKSKGVENLTDIGISLASTMRKLNFSTKGPGRICIDLVSDILLQHHAVQTRRWLTALMTELKSTGFTTLAVFDPEMHSSQDVRAILDLFDGEINIHEKETEKGLEKYLKIKRMSNYKYLENELPLKEE
jgi:tetratricopeptide (TPR) repeat protein